VDRGAILAAENDVVDPSGLAEKVGRFAEKNSLEAQQQVNGQGF